MPYRSSRLLGTVLTAGLVSAACTGVVPSTTSASIAAPLPVEPHDFASETYGDPWDYSNPSDQPLHGGSGGIAGVTGAALRDGALVFRAGTAPRVDLVGSYGGALAHGREGAATPVPAQSYPRFAMALTSSAAGSGGLFWFTCREMLPSCSGGMPLSVRAGAQVLDAPIARRFGTAAWAGDIVGVRFVPVAGASASIDWTRLYRPEGGTAAGTTAPERVDARPRPVVLDPDAAGGQDYATAVRGNAWDMAQSTDVARLSNIAGAGFGLGRLTATNGAPRRNDPQLVLPLGPRPIDGDRYHRLTFRYSYDGPFGLANAPGGGAMTRLVWQVAGSGAYQELEDVVTYPHERTVTVDLAGNPTDPAQNGARLGWSGRSITFLRFDPNEDPGARRWRLDDVRVAADDGGGTSFDVRFSDGAWQQGTTAEVFADADRRGFDGVRVGTGIAVAAGTNTWRWTNTTLPAGTYWLHVRLSDGRSSGQAYASGPVRMLAGR